MPEATPTPVEASLAVDELSDEQLVEAAAAAVFVQLVEAAAAYGLVEHNLAINHTRLEAIETAARRRKLWERARAIVDRQLDRQPHNTDPRAGWPYRKGARCGGTHPSYVEISVRPGVGGRVFMLFEQREESPKPEPPRIEFTLVLDEARKLARALEQAKGTGRIAVHEGGARVGEIQHHDKGLHVYNAKKAHVMVDTLPASRKRFARHLAEAVAIAEAQST